MSRDGTYIYTANVDGNVLALQVRELVDAMPTEPPNNTPTLPQIDAPPFAPKPQPTEVPGLEELAPTSLPFTVVEVGNDESSKGIYGLSVLALIPIVAVGCIVYRKRSGQQAPDNSSDVYEIGSTTNDSTSGQPATNESGQQLGRTDLPRYKDQVRTVSSAGLADFEEVNAPACQSQDLPLENVEGVSTIPPRRQDPPAARATTDDSPDQNDQRCSVPLENRNKEDPPSSKAAAVIIDATRVTEERQKDDV